MTRMTDFDPYDALIELNERLSELEYRHNKLVVAYELMEAELIKAHESIRVLQKSHFSLSNFVSNHLDNIKLVDPAK